MESFICSRQSYCHMIIILCLAFFCIEKISWAAKIQPHLMESSNGDDFIKTSCEVTRYPDLCYQTLSAYASSIQDNPTQLANAALNVTLKSAESTSNMVLKMLKARNLRPKEVAAIRDCVENLGDSVDQLQQSLVTMRDLEGPDFEMKMGDILTWVSSALTDEDTCMDGFEENAIDGKVEDTIRGYIETVTQLTSNALALINKLVN